MTNNKNEMVPNGKRSEVVNASNSDNNPKKTKKKIVKKNKPKKEGPRAQRIIAYILITIVSIGLIGTMVVGAFAWKNIRNAPEVTSSSFIPTASSTILDDKGEVIANTGMVQRNNVKYDELPVSLVDALVSIEDSRFFGHNGFDVPRFTKAAFSNLFDSLKRGRISFGQGGSTLTMQLIKNSLFVNDGDKEGAITGAASSGSGGISRKIQEIYLAEKVERNNILSKEMILEQYLNRIDFGAGRGGQMVRGVGQSSKAYFGKEVSELSLVESAFLAGVLNAPYGYSPYYSSSETVNKRTQEVLSLMEYHGYITTEERELARNVKVENLLVDNSTNNVDSVGTPYLAFTDQVMKDVKKLTGKDPATTTMIIHTTMNKEVQQAIDKVQNREVANLNHGKDREIQMGSVVIENATGEIKGIVGGYDYINALSNPRGTNILKQPASTIKPVVDYAPAFEYLGWATSHVITDEPIAYTNSGGTLYNYDRAFQGEIELKQAIGDSRNVPAVKALKGVVEKIGEDSMIDYLFNIGFSEVKNKDAQFNLGYGIGGSFNASPVQVAGAYTVLFNEGKYIEPHTVTKVEFPDENTPPLIPEYPSTQVLSDGAAYLATRGMLDVMQQPQNWTANPMKRGYPIFGKTGTQRWEQTDGSLYGIPAGNQKERWMVGASSKFSIATWTGFDLPSKDNRPYFTSAEHQFNLAGKLNGYLFNELDKQYGPGTDISVPSSVTQITHIKGPFPYQSPLPDMNKDLVTTGYIKKEFASLKEATAQSLDSLSSQKVTASASKNTIKFDVALSAYPNPEKLKVADSKLTMTAPDGAVYTGAKIYDETWIYGAVRYKTEIRVNGSPVKEELSESENISLTISAPKATDKVQVCSYYTYDKAPNMKSNEVCEDIDVGALPVSQDFSRFIGDSIFSFNEWLKSIGSTKEPKTSYQFSDKYNYDTIMKINPDYSNQNVTQKQMAETEYNVTLADREVKADGKQSAANYKAAYGKIVTFQNPSNDDSKLVKGFIVDGKTVTSFPLSSQSGKTVTLVIAD